MLDEYKVMCNERERERDLRSWSYLQKWNGQWLREWTVLH